MTRAKLVLAVCGAVAIFAHGTTVAAQGLAPGAQVVSRALALVVAATTPLTIGTAFAVRSNPGQTVFLTAAHVVGCVPLKPCSPSTVTLYLNGALRRSRPGRVVATGKVERDDLAAIVIDDGPFPTVDLGNVLADGTLAAALGYPDSTLDAVRNQRLESVADTVLSLGKVRSDDGTTLRGDFETFPGDSGGPVFDAKTGRVSGVVHGVVSGVYLAIGSRVIDAFLSTAYQQLGDTTSIAARPLSRHDADASYRKAQQVRQHDSVSYSHYLEIAAGEGSAFAADELAIAYLRGEGVSVNSTLANGWRERANAMLRAAADAGDADAAYLFAKRIRSRDAGEYARYLRIAAESGNGLAADALGRAYSNGEGVEKSSDLRRLWLDRAQPLIEKMAAAGNGEANALLGYWSELNAIPNASPEMSLRYFQRGAEGGDEQAMMTLGDSYTRGSFTKPDLRNALRWYCYGAVRGNTTLMGRLFSLYDFGLGGMAKNPSLAQSWLEAQSSGHGAADARALCAKEGVTF